MIQDILRRFLLESAHVRGEWVHLDTSWQQMLQRADYPPTVRAVLGEALTAIVLLSATVKHQGSIILQIQGEGPIHLLVVQATPNGQLRGLARWKTEPQGSSLPALFGDEARMVITMEAAGKSERYQGMIALEGESLTHALEQYFQQSEQLPTRLWLTTGEQSCAGILIQRLPQVSTATFFDPEQQSEDWNRISMLLDTLTHEELQSLEPEALIYRLFHDESPRIFEAKSIRFQCSCSQERVDTMLRSLGEAEAKSILEEQGQIEVTCEFCNARYQLDKVDVARLFTAGVVEPATHTLH